MAKVIRLGEKLEIIEQVHPRVMDIIRIFRRPRVSAKKPQNWELRMRPGKRDRFWH